MSAGESAAAVADDGVVPVFCLHDEVVGVGYLGCFDDLLHGGVLYAEGDVVVKGVVEEDGLLVDVADEGAEVVDADVAYVLAVNEYLPFADVVVAGNKVHEGGFS